MARGVVRIDILGEIVDRQQGLDGEPMDVVLEGDEALRALAEIVREQGERIEALGLAP